MICSVLLCDDDPGVGRDWVEQVRSVAPADRYAVRDAPHRDEVHGAIAELFARQMAVIEGRPHKRVPRLFDDVDILVLDYDLLRIDDANARHTGESLARLVRIFANVEVVVVVNQFREAQFDLSLRGHPSSDADLNIDAGLLGSGGLWADPPWDGFRPWAWQALGRAVATQRARRKWIVGRMQESIVEALGMEDGDVARLSDAAFGFLAPAAANWSELHEQTFESFACGPTGFRHGAELLKAIPEDACRFLAARVGKWLERQVLGPQDVLIDLPHLIQRYPFLLGGDVDDLDAWNAVICEESTAKLPIPEGCSFDVAGLLSKPAVWRQRFERDQGVQRTRCAYDYSAVPPFVFLEDVSRFAPIDEATEFRAGYHNAFDRRFAECVEGVTYAPQRRLAWAE